MQFGNYESAVSVRANTPLTDLIRSGLAVFTTIDGVQPMPACSPIGSWVANGRTLKTSVSSRYLMGRLPSDRAFRRRFAHSHSGSQFLPHLPSHWYSNILPPHCGQTRLRIDERMRTFNSPGGASMVIMFGVSPRSCEGNTGQNDGGMPRGFCALCDAPNWLAAESVHASRAAPSLSMGQAISMPP